VPVVQNAVQLNLSTSYLNEDQLSLIFKTAKLNTQLRSLNLSGVNLSGVSSELLANVAAALVSVNLSSSKLVGKQVVSLFSRLLGSCRLRILDIGGINISQVPSKLLALALSRLRVVKLSNCFLNRDQLVEVCKQIQENYTTLEYISLSRNILLLNQMELSSLNQHLFVKLD